MTLVTRRLGGAVLGLLVLAVSPARAADPKSAPPDAELLLNLELLREADLRQQRELLSRMGVLERMRLIENLKVLESPAPPITPAQREVK